MTDDTILVSQNLTRSNRHYHTDPEWYNLPKNPREWPIERADRYDLTECKICRGDVERSKQGWTHQRAIKAYVEAQDD